VEKLRDYVYPRYHDCRAMYASFNTDGEGEISLDDIIQHTKGMGLEKKDLGLAFNAVDINGDGAIDFPEFCQMFNPDKFPKPTNHPVSVANAATLLHLHNVLEQKQRTLKECMPNHTKLYNAIRHQDPISSGTLSVAQFKEALGKGPTGLNLPLSEAELDKIAQSCDPARTGTVQYRGLLRQLSQLDLNEDVAELRQNEDGKKKEWGMPQHRVAQQRSLDHFAETLLRDAPTTNDVGSATVHPRMNTPSTAPSQRDFGKRAHEALEEQEREEERWEDAHDQGGAGMFMQGGAGEKSLARLAKARSVEEQRHAGEALTERTRERLAKARFYLDENGGGCTGRTLKGTQRSIATSRDILAELDTGGFGAQGLEHNTRSGATPIWLHADTYGRVGNGAGVNPNSGLYLPASERWQTASLHHPDRAQRMKDASKFTNSEHVAFEKAAKREKQYERRDNAEKRIMRHYVTNEARKEIEHQSNLKSLSRQQLGYLQQVSKNEDKAEKKAQFTGFGMKKMYSGRHLEHQWHPDPGRSSFRDPDPHH
jgi:Ca2+-binding EF-hand superfamily protein